MLFLFFKMFQRFEKVVRGGKNGVKWGKKADPESPYIHYSHAAPQKIERLLLILLLWFMLLLLLLLKCGAVGGGC